MPWWTNLSLVIMEYMQFLYLQPTKRWLQTSHELSQGTRRELIQSLPSPEWFLQLSPSKGNGIDILQGLISEHYNPVYNLPLLPFLTSPTFLWAPSSPSCLKINQFTAFENNYQLLVEAYSIKALKHMISIPHLIINLIYAIKIVNAWPKNS